MNLKKIRTALLRTFYFLCVFFIVSIISVLIINFIVMPAIENRGEERILLDVRDLSWEEAASLLKREGFIPMRGKMRPAYGKEPFTVLSQRPNAGSQVKMKRRVYLDLSTTGAKIPFSNLIGHTLRSSRIILENQRMVIDTVYYRYSSKPRNVVFWQSVPPDKKVFPGTKVKLKVSLGLSVWTVPDVIDMSKKDAINKIKRAGLEIGKITETVRNDLLENTVLSQSISPETELHSRKRINIVVSKFSSNFIEE
ncbi:MAG: PASTA domain-containing protein [Candidatus Marinimicrobia bacterium]|nr:PASTA domain-containing protein [Candidatus Neomarinimicrobiota bacterium]